MNDRAAGDRDPVGLGETVVPGPPAPARFCSIERYIADVALYRRSLGTMTLDHVVAALRTDDAARRTSGSGAAGKRSASPAIGGSN
jgi:hypothetical protein